MVEETVDRFRSSNIVAFARPTIVASARHRHLIDARLPGVDAILEPMGRDSAPAIAAASLAAAPDDLLLVSPADHHVRRPLDFHRRIADSIPAAQDGKLVTFGVTPDFPATGYGYIEAADDDGGPEEVRKAARFVEKPDRETAAAYVASGRFFWNAGAFLFKAGAMVEALRTYARDVLDAAEQALEGLPDGPTKVLDARAFVQAPKISIDYAVFEPASRDGAVAVAPSDIGWSDIGDHLALHEAQRDAPAIERGPAYAAASQNVLLVSDGPFVAAVGLKNVAVVANADGFLACDLSAAQKVKEVAEIARGFGIGALLPKATRDRVRAWLFDDALPLWSAIAWDEAHGGFKEAVALAAPHAETADVRRVRVQARQVYAFAHARVLGWPGDAEGLVRRGVRHLTEKCYRPGRGYAHLIDREGKVIDPRTDLYDQAFALNAFAWAHRALGDASFLEHARSLVDLIDGRLRRRDGAYADDDRSGDPADGPLRANPHMHLLEAFLALYEASQDPAFLDRAEAIVELFERRFFDPACNCVREHFNADWSLNAEKGDLIEPGHGYEWASLLAKFDRYRERDTTSWQRRLVAGADAIGLKPAGPFAFNVVSPDGEVVDGARRLWPQTERLRARLVRPNRESLTDAAGLVDALFATYLADAPRGLWMDAYGPDDAPAARDAPGSMLYHLVAAFAPIIDPDNA